VRRGCFWIRGGVGFDTDELFSESLTFRYEQNASSQDSSPTPPPCTRKYLQHRHRRYHRTLHAALVYNIIASRTESHNSLNMFVLRISPPASPPLRLPHSIFKKPKPFCASALCNIRVYNIILL
jgi:hypothetical protein